MNFRIVFLIVLLSLAGCSRTPEWTLFFYPDVPASHSVTIEQSSAFDSIHGYYDSLELCRVKAKGMQRLAGDKGSYQCGHLCQVTDGQLACKTLTQ